MGVTTKGKNTDAALAEQLIAGTNKHLANLGQLLLASGTFTPAQVMAQLQALVTLRTNANDAKAAAKAKLATEEAQVPPLRSFMATYVAFLKAAFGNSPDVLADFGLQPKKAATPPTAEQKAAATVKRAATREARGTKGPKAKKSVKGAVTGIVVTPITAGPPVVTVPNAPSTPSAAASPAAPAIPAAGATGTTGGTTPHA
jgi:hypothetical protein